MIVERQERARRKKNGHSRTEMKTTRKEKMHTHTHTFWSKQLMTVLTIDIFLMLLQYDCCPQYKMVFVMYMHFSYNVLFWEHYIKYKNNSRITEDTAKHNKSPYALKQAFENNNKIQHSNNNVRTKHKYQINKLSLFGLLLILTLLCCLFYLLFAVLYVI